MPERVLAERTGGRATSLESADESFARLAQLTSFQYLLGFYPANPPAEGEYREIRVLVKRRGVKLFYRHGYEARREVDEPVDVRRVFTDFRIQQTAGWAWPQQSAKKRTPTASGTQALSNIPTKLSLEVITGPADLREVRVHTAFDPKFVTFTQRGRQYSASLDVAIFVDDPEGKLLAKTLERVDLTLDEESFARLLRQRIEHSAQLEVTGRPAHVRVVVYEYDTDRAGWARDRIR